MTNIKVSNSNLTVPSIVSGCMRFGEFTTDQMVSFIHKALENGVNFFDHADIYAGGKSEEIFGKALAADKSIKREDLIIQSKCGIRQGFFDFSKEHILESVDGILSRLQLEYLDVLLLPSFLRHLRSHRGVGIDAAGEGIADILIGLIVAVKKRLRHIKSCLSCCEYFASRNNIYTHTEFFYYAIYLLK